MALMLCWPSERPGDSCARSPVGPGPAVRGRARRVRASACERRKQECRHPASSRSRVPQWNDCATLARVESPCRSFTIGRRSGSWPQAHPLASRSKLDSLGVSAESTRKRVRDEDPTQPLLCRCLLAAALNDCFSAVAERAVSLQRAQTRGHGITVRCPQCGERHAWTRAPRHRGKVGYHTPLESARHFSDRTSRKSKPSGFWSCGGQF